LAAGIPFALFPASPTPYELKHLVKVSKVKKIFASPRNLENARIIAKEAGFSESDGIFILEGKVKGNGRSMTSFVPSRNPQRITRNPWVRTPWRISYFPAERPARPKVRHFYKRRMRSLARAHRVEFFRRHDIAQEYYVLSDAGLHYRGTEQSALHQSVPPLNPI
jgi:hypothetical protein